MILGWSCNVDYIITVVDEFVNGKALAGASITYQVLSIKYLIMSSRI